jgi:H+/gluconate symporter-like permease
MKRTINVSSIKALFAAILMLLVNIAVQAQEKVTTTVTHAETQTTSWIGNNWMWVAGGVLLLIILIALGSSGSRRTTVTRDNITGTTTTTVEE